MSEEDDKKKEEKKPAVSLGMKIGGFLAAIILLTFLLAGTCIPIGLLAGQSPDSKKFVYAITAYTFLFGIFFLRRAFKYKNAGEKWGTILFVFLILSCATILLINF